MDVNNMVNCFYFGKSWKRFAGCGHSILEDFTFQMLRWGVESGCNKKQSQTRVATPLMFGSTINTTQEGFYLMAMKFATLPFNQNAHFYAGSPDLNNDDTKLLDVIYNIIRCIEKDFIIPTNRRLAELAKVSERTIARILNKLESLKYIKREGMGWARKIKLGMMFTMAYAACSELKQQYTESRQKKKNLHNRAKQTAQRCHTSIQNKNTLIRDNKTPSLEELHDRTMYRHYMQCSPHLMPERLKYLESKI